MIVRPATADDWPSVRELLIELGRPDVRDADADHAASYRAYLDRGDALVLLAEDDGAIVGLVDVEFRQRLNFATPQAWVPDLIVTEPARSRGAGAALLARAEVEARARGCWGITLESAAWRERAHAFYRANGWVDTGLAFTKSLDGTPWPPAPR